MIDQNLVPVAKWWTKASPAAKRELSERLGEVLGRDADNQYKMLSSLFQGRNCLPATRYVVIDVWSRMFTGRAVGHKRAQKGTVNGTQTAQGGT